MATVTLVTTKLKPSLINWSEEDVHEEFMIFKTLDKMCLQMKSVPDHKKYMFILQLLGKAGLHYWESFPFVTPNKGKEQPECILEAFRGSLRQNTRIRCYRTELK